MIVASVIVAAGSGVRYGSKKQFEVVKDGKIVLDYSVERLSKFGRVCIVAKSEDVSFLQSRYRVLVVEGGEERKHSVFNGLKAIGDCHVVLIHDAARPVLSSLNIELLIYTALKFGAAIFSVPIYETVKLIRGGDAIATLDRRRLIISQTPQAFDFRKLFSIMKQYVDEWDFTDEAALWEKVFGSVKLIEGSKKNIKITTKEDMEIVRCLLG